MNIEQVTNDWLQRSGELEDSKQKYLTDRRALDTLRGQIEAMNEESQVFPESSQRYLELRTQIAIKTKEHEVRTQSSRLSQDREQAKLMTEAYEKTLLVIRDLAKEKNLDVVMLKQSGKLEGFNLGEVGSNILVRTVVYIKDEIDITDEVMERMK